MSAYKFIAAAAVLSVAVLLAPVQSMADTTADLNAQIQELYAQIKQLQAQLASGNSGFCYTFNNNVSIGQTGGDVTNLQTALQKDGESVSASGSFDEQTASAVSAFQEKYRSDVLAPTGLPAGTGYVGARTRTKLNALFGCRIISQPPVSCTMDAKLCPDGTYVSRIAPHCDFAACPIPATVQPSLIVLSPNGGEAWVRGTTQTIRWQDVTDHPTCPAGAYCVSAAPRYYDITLQPYYPPCIAGNVCPYGYRAPYTIAQNVNGFTYSWSVGNVASGMNSVAPDDPYTIQICRSGTDTCDSSNSYFKIVSPVSTNGSPQILYPQGGEVLRGGTANYISWNPVSYDGAFDVSIIGVGSNNSYLIAQGVAAQATNKQSIQWTPQAGAYQKDTQFIAQVCRTGTDLCSKSNGFTVIFATSTLPPIGISTTPPVMCPSWGCGLYVPFPISTSTTVK